MTEFVNNNLISASTPPPAIQAQRDDGMNLDAHYTKNMKVKRPSVNPDRVATIIPEQKTYSNKEADKKLQQLNTDVFTSYQKEKSSHEFNFKTYFKIFCAVVLAAASFAGIRFLKKFFGKK